LAFPDAKKRVVNSARLRTGPIITQIPRDYQKKSLFGRKPRYCVILREKTPFLAFPEAKKLAGSLSCMQKGPKCIQSLWQHPKKIHFVQKHKEGAICAILRKKNPFLAFPEAKKVLLTAQGCARLRTAAQGCALAQ